MIVEGWVGPRGPGVDALQEPVAAYGAGFEGENEVLRAKNRFLRTQT